jgi:integrase
MTFKRGGVWYIRYTDIRGRDVRSATKAPTKKAADLLEAEEAQRVERQRRGFQPASKNPDGHTVRSLALWAIGKKARTRNAYTLKTSLEAHLVGDFAALPIDLVTPSAVRRWLDERQVDAKISDATTNRLRAYLSGVFRLAIEHGLAFENPVTTTRPRIVEPPAPRMLAPHLIPLLLSEVPPSWRLAVALASFAGMRRGEIRALEWRNVDLAAGLIYVEKTKANRPRVVPISKELARYLGNEAGRGRVIPKAWWGHSAVIIREALVRCGVDLQGVPATFHGLRHTWATQWIACGARADVVEIVGWGPRGSSAMQRFYLHLPPALLHAEMAKLDFPAEAPGRVLELEKKLGTNPAQRRVGNP